MPASLTTRLKPFLLLTILVFSLFGVFASGLHRYFTFSELQAHHQTLQQWKDQHYLLCTFSYLLLYTLAVAISIPGATLLTLVGGFLFGLFLGTVYVVMAATLGAMIIFVATKTALAPLFEAKVAPSVAALKKGFHDNAMSYLLFLRLVPIFPFWLVNIVPGLLAIPLRTFVIATFLGIIPGSFIYVWVGSGLSRVFADNQPFHFNRFLQPNILFPLLALALLSLIPVIYKFLQTGAKHGNTNQN